MDCPIKGCKHTFAHGIRGWDAHVGKVENHPTWHPKIRSLKGRKDTFIRTFPDFFRAELRPVVHQSGTYAKFQAIVEKLDRLAQEAEALTKTA